MTIDTLSIAKDVRAAKLPPEQAEAIAAAIGRSIVEGSATKADIDMTKSDLKADFGSLRTEFTNLKAESKAEFALVRIEIEKLRTEIEKGRNQIIIWLIGAQAALAGIIIALLRH